MKSKLFNFSILLIIIVLAQSCKKQTKGWQCETYNRDGASIGEQFEGVLLSTEIFRADQNNWSNYDAAVIDARARQRSKANTTDEHLLADSIICTEGFFLSSDFN